MIIDPRNLTFEKWANFTRQQLETLVPSSDIPVVTPRSSSWQKWAYAVYQNPALQGLHPPDPRHVTDWKSWAFRFNECLGG